MHPVHSARRYIPSFSLYGERPASGHTDALHVEDIPSRSRKYLWNIAAHRHNNLCQCVFVSNGPVTVELDGSLTAFPGPAVILIPAGTVHGFRFRADTQGYVLTVDLDRLLSLASAAHQAPIQALFSTSRAIDLRKDPLLAGRTALLLERLLAEFRQPESLLTPVGSWLACSVFWVLAPKCTAVLPADAHSSQELDRLRRFRLLIESQYLRHWPVARYARQLALSESSLNRLCRRLTGQTAFDLVQQRMALEARRRLVYVAGSVAALAAQLGFRDAAYFCRFFRRHNGMSPGEYRRRQGGG
jgi:AraC family transcriptional regulator, transcriptional activator of pobA